MEEAYAVITARAQTLIRHGAALRPVHVAGIPNSWVLPLLFPSFFILPVILTPGKEVLRAPQERGEARL